MLRTSMQPGFWRAWDRKRRVGLQVRGRLGFAHWWKVENFRQLLFGIHSYSNLPILFCWTLAWRFYWRCWLLCGGWPFGGFLRTAHRLFNSFIGTRVCRWAVSFQRSGGGLGGIKYLFKCWRAQNSIYCSKVIFFYFCEVLTFNLNYKYNTIARLPSK